MRVNDWLLQGSHVQRMVQRLQFDQEGVRLPVTNKQMTASKTIA
jgi:hypothetical protein